VCLPDSTDCCLAAPEDIRFLAGYEATGTPQSPSTIRRSCLSARRPQGGPAPFGLRTIVGLQQRIFLLGHPGKVMGNVEWPRDAGGSICRGSPVWPNSCRGRQGKSMGRTTAPHEKRGGHAGGRNSTNLSAGDVVRICQGCRHQLLVASGPEIQPTCGQIKGY